MLLQKDDHILFFGDSITARGRMMDKAAGLGDGFVRMVADQLASRWPELNLKVTNRGIGGNRIRDLENRLQADVIVLKPGVVSILAGINDTWRRYDKNVLSPVEDFAQAYRRICSRIVGELGARLVICEPFALAVPPVQKHWREDLDPRIQATREVAGEFKALYIPLDGIMAAATCQHAPKDLLKDGVHPTEIGHALIARTWINAVTS